MKVAILGSGAMGTACATILAHNQIDTIIYGIDLNELTDLKEGKNSKYFPNIVLPKFNTTNNIDEAIADANAILFAIPSKFLPPVFDLVSKKIEKNTIIINVAKGFWPETFVSIHEKMNELAAENKYIEGIVSLIGPSFAIDMVNKSITLVDTVSNHEYLAKQIQKLFSNEYFRVYIQTDIVGAECGSIFKNMLAIGSGIIKGLEFPENTQAAFLTRGLVEMNRFTIYKGGKLATNYGLTGLGDLILTALSPKSRNFQFGFDFITKNQKNPPYTVEGLKSIEVIYRELIATKKINLPIVESLYKIIYLDLDPKEIIKSLMKRPLGMEN